MEFKLGQKVKVNDYGTISEIITTFDNIKETKEYVVISNIDNERIRLSENKIERIEENKNAIANIIKSIFKLRR